LLISHQLTTTQNFMEHNLELNARGVVKYSDVGHVEGYISVMVQFMASGTIND